MYNYNKVALPIFLAQVCTERPTRLVLWVMTDDQLCIYIIAAHLVEVNYWNLLLPSNAPC